MTASSTPSDFSDAKIDRFPVANLPAKYGIKQAALYERLKAVGIKPHRSGRSAFLDAEQLQVMDALAEHLKRGDGMKAFVQKHKSNQQDSGSQGIATAPSLSLKRVERTLTVLDAKFETLIDQGERVEQRAAVREETELLLLRYDKLQKSIDILESVAAKQVTLSTSQVSELLGISTTTVGAKKSFDRMGFRFVKVGRSGREAAWAISKIPEPFAGFTDSI